MSKLTKYENKKDFCFAKTKKKKKKKIVAKLIFERAVMVDIFTGSPFL